MELTDPDVKEFVTEVAKIRADASTRLGASASRTVATEPCPARAIKQVQRRQSVAEQREVAEAYQRGTPVTEIAEQFGISRNTVNEIRRREGVAAHPKRALSPEVQRAAKLYQDGQSLAQVGRQFSVNAETIRSALEAIDVTIRPRNGWG